MRVKLLFLVIGIIVGLSVAVGMQSLLNAIDASTSKRGIADCKVISVALEEYRKAHGQYPPLEGGVEDLSAYLVPAYLGSVPTRDALGQPYLVFMHGPIAAVVSTGRHGIVVEANRVVRDMTGRRPE
jgi:type II secretory pathway pseudopilin PulG